MEIDISSLASARVFDFSHSVCEGGPNAGTNTWRAAIAETKAKPLLQTPEELTALRDYVGGFGAWTDEEIAAWSDNECNALFLQLISGDVREMGFDSLEDMTDDDWTAYEADENARHNIFRAEDRRIYYTLSN